eukprot:5160666-Amphidinium_carterae.1
MAGDSPEPLSGRRMKRERASRRTTATAADSTAGAVYTGTAKNFVPVRALRLLYTGFAAEKRIGQHTPVNVESPHTVFRLVQEQSNCNSSGLIWGPPLRNASSCGTQTSQEHSGALPLSLKKQD